MKHTSHAHWSEVDRTCRAHLASGEWSPEWVGHAIIWDTPIGGEAVCYRVTQFTKSPGTKGCHWQSPVTLSQAAVPIAGRCNMTGIWLYICCNVWLWLDPSKCWSVWKLSNFNSWKWVSGQKVIQPKLDRPDCLLWPYTWHIRVIMRYCMYYRTDFTCIWFSGWNAIHNRHNCSTTCNFNSDRDNYNTTLHTTLQTLSLHKDSV